MAAALRVVWISIALSTTCLGQSGVQDFARRAEELREKAILKVKPEVLVPNSRSPTSLHYPWKTNIVVTVFWIGENRSVTSAWDAKWSANYGGIDDPDPKARKNYIPSAFTPRLNPFYCALPYNDVSHGQFKPEAPLVIPWFKQAYTGPGQSVCQHHWIAVRKGNRTCYAQWEDCGPFRSDHYQYVFQNERPKPNANRGTGLNVSPAVQGYLGLQTTDVVDWRFVDTADISPGPWRSYGENNHFVIARRMIEREMGQQQKSDKLAK